MYIKDSMTLKEIVENYPETIDFFVGKGISGLENREVREKFGNISLKMALGMKKINVEDFIETLENFLCQKRESVDVTLSEKKKNSEGVSITGLLPCPVRIPLLEGFNSFLENHPEIKVNYELKAASSGLDWLKEDVIKANRPEALSDMFISAGFDLFFEKELMGKFKAQGIFKDITGVDRYNRDFNNDEISLKDPSGDYSMLAVVPAIFLVNRDELNGREYPKTWADILKPEFAKSVSLPISDFDLFNAILVNIYKLYGEEGVRNLGRSLLESMHPAQMVKSDKQKIKRPTITIMPFFFSKMTRADGPMQTQWPEDGAIISPIFMLTKREKSQELKEITKFLASKEVGEILSHKGFFPSVNPEVENPTSGKKFMWVGWDYIYNNDIGELVRKCEKLFYEGVEKQ